MTRCAFAGLPDGPRTQALRAVAVCIAADSQANLERMLDCGWPVEDALVAIRETYRPWLFGHLGLAVEEGIAQYRSAAQEHVA